MVTNETPAAESTAQFAKRIFNELQQTILAQEAGALAGEVAAIHDMRVGVRRLRVALSNFAVCLDKQERRRWRRRLNHLADALGGVRDLDVLIGTLQTNQSRHNADERLAIKALLRRLRARRRHRQQQLVIYLRSAEYLGFKQEGAAANAARMSEEEAHGQAA